MTPQQILLRCILTAIQREFGGDLSHIIMPRRSTRVPLGETPAGDGDTKRKRYSTGSTVKSTAKKSKYFEGSDSDEPVSEDDSGSAYEEAEGPDEGGDPATENSESEEEEVEAKPKPKRRGRPSGGAKAQKQKTDNVIEDLPTAEAVRGKELWREGVKTGLGPGKEVFIKKPKARDLGGVDYQDDTIHPNTMLFLKDLKKNNERQWLKGIEPIP